MNSLGKENIFQVGESVEDTDFETVISKFDYLMSTPEKMIFLGAGYENFKKSLYANNEKLSVAPS